ncbi:MAG: thioredoxin family protein [Polyangiaceae bacterium]|nr:thioredoxin family protein [Polyangiaceae bacterium]
MTMHTVEVLYFDGCPHAPATIDRVRKVIASMRRPDLIALRIVAIESDEQAEEHRFLGSPSVRVDGRDVEQGADARTDYGIQCRVYTEEDGAPPEGWIRDALHVE